MSVGVEKGKRFLLVRLYDYFLNKKLFKEFIFPEDEKNNAYTIFKVKLHK